MYKNDPAADKDALTKNVASAYRGMACKYSGTEDRLSKPPWPNVLPDPISTNTLDDMNLTNGLAVTESV